MILIERAPFLVRAHKRLSLAFLPARGQEFNREKFLTGISSISVYPEKWHDIQPI
jgi:hypothetical protein